MGATDTIAAVEVADVVSVVVTGGGRAGADVIDAED